MYLAPDSDSDGETDYTPVSLPDGRMACYRHLRIVCNDCCVDFSEMEAHEVSEDDEDDDDVNHVPHLAARDEPPPHTGYFNDMPPISGAHDTPQHVFPTKFTPPSPGSRPSDIFQGLGLGSGITRFIRTTDPQTVLIYTDGACLGNGQPNPRAGWAFAVGPRWDDDRGGSGPYRTVSGRLENEGPTGVAAAQTSNRAEMRAAIAALRFRAWDGEGFRTVVIATDSAYLVDGATSWARGWVRNGWRTRSGEEVKNRDLWEYLLATVKMASANGLAVQFWQIPREYNTVVDEAAKSAAEKPNVARYGNIFGALM